MDDKPFIAISIGDPAGIGPEITVKALHDPEVWAVSTPVAVGSLSVLQEISHILDSDLPLSPVSAPFSRPRDYGVLVVDCGLPTSKVEFGKVSKEAGEASYLYVNRAIDLALAGDVGAVVTGPIHKEAIHLAGCPHPGHTEIFADRTKTGRYAMMLSHGDFRVSHVCTHVSLRRACDLCKRERVLETIRLTGRALMDMGIESPRMAVAGLNPHAGEGGLFGREEIDEIIPAIQDARAEGFIVDGPVPPDTVFVKAIGRQYDAVIAMYHDQGHIPVKVAGFDLDPITGKWASVKGVNMTLGLPIIRTSVDHGTAFGKAGKGTANAESMIDAIKIAATMARHRIR